MRRLARLVGALALLAGAAGAQTSGQGRGAPGGLADCARGGDVLVRMICASPALAAAGLDNARV